MICGSCYREIPSGGNFCPRCGLRLGGGAPAPASPEGQAAGVRTNPWEERAGRGVVTAFAETLQQTLFHPVAFFRGTAPDRGAGAALLYAVVVGTLSILVALLWQRALGEQLSLDRSGRILGFFSDGVALALLLFVVPVAVAGVCLASAAVQHLTLAVLGGARGTYLTTLKAVCYSSSALAFNVFPICGALVGALWQVVVQVVGMRELHRTSTARAFLAWLLPLVIATCLAGAVFIAMALGLLKFMLGFSEGRFAA